MEEVKKFLKLLESCDGRELCGRDGKNAGGTPAPLFCHLERHDSLSAIFSLRCVPNGVDGYLLPLHPIQQHVGSTADDQFPNAGFCSDVSQIRVISQSFGATEETFPNAASLMSLRYAFQNAKAHDVTVLAASGDVGATNYESDGATLYPYRVIAWPPSDPYPRFMR